jgi:hypothetical protein
MLLPQLHGKAAPRSAMDLELGSNFDREGDGVDVVQWVEGGLTLEITRRAELVTCAPDALAFASNFPFSHLRFHTHQPPPPILFFNPVGTL